MEITVLNMGRVFASFIVYNHKILRRRTDVGLETRFHLRHRPGSCDQRRDLRFWDNGSDQ